MYGLLYYTILYCTIIESPILPSKDSDSRTESFELASNVEAFPIHLSARRSSAAEALLPSHRSYVGSNSKDQAILDAIEHLTGHMLLKDSRTGAQLKDPLLTRLQLAAGLGGTDIRKTLSEPDLVEVSIDTFPNF